MISASMVAAYIFFCPPSNGALGCQKMDKRQVDVRTCGNKGFFLYKKVSTEHRYPMWIRGRLEIRCIRK